jgi:hypothetical protein
MEIFKAHDQWANRPDDERFKSVKDLYDATKAYADTARERDDVRVDTLRVEAVDGSVKLVGKGNIPAALTHWSFGQLAARVDAPASYLRSLPATLAVQNLNHGLKERVKTKEDATANLLFHANGDLLLRAITSDKYSRIWNYEIADRLLDMESRGWTPATPDIRRQSDDPNDPHNFSLYASDHDLFAFMMHSDKVIKEAGNPLGLKRGVIAGNSEVGGGSLWLMEFLYREMCGNHIIWGAEDVLEVRARHVGSVRDKFAEWSVLINAYMNESASLEEARIAQAQSKRIAGTKEELLDALFGKRSLALSRKTLEAGYNAVVPEEDGDPLTVWGFVQGVTRYSQTTPYGDERTKIDRAAGKILEMAF